MSQQELQKLIEEDITNNPVGVTPVTELQSQNRFWQQLRVPMEQRPVPPQGGQEGIPPGTEPNVAMLLGLSARLVKPPFMDLVGPNQFSGQEQTTQELFNPLKPGRELDIYEQIKIKIGNEAAETNLPMEGVGEKAGVPKEANEPGAGLKPGVSTMGAAGITDVYKSFAAYSDDKFNRHIRAAENYMKQGKFYRAADAYTLATIYKPNDPLGYAGKSQALFAAGEYMSSALFLARALEIFPEYAELKIDLVGMIGDKDTVENRILEAREWLDRSQSAELEFLLSYVYYQMDRLEFARKAIESAAKKMPDSPAVLALKKAIDERIANL
jgi:tetratricopeptide (TPR) repeat protein